MHERAGARLAGGGVGAWFFPWRPTGGRVNCRACARRSSCSSRSWPSAVPRPSWPRPPARHPSRPSRPAWTVPRTCARPSCGCSIAHAWRPIPSGSTARCQPTAPPSSGGSSPRRRSGAAPSSGCRCWSCARPARPTCGGPTVLVLHGTGGTKESQREWLDRLAGKGFLAVAIDARYHGERVGVRGGARGLRRRHHRRLAGQAGRAGAPLLLRHRLGHLADGRLSGDPPRRRPRAHRDAGALDGRHPDLAGGRGRRARPGGGAGHRRPELPLEPGARTSGRGGPGTIWAAHEAAAADLGEKEVNQRVCRALWSKILPGILDRFDGPSMLRLIAPRPLLVTSGELDPNCPLGGRPGGLRGRPRCLPRRPAPPTS